MRKFGSENQEMGGKDQGTRKWRWLGSENQKMGGRRIREPGSEEVWIRESGNGRGKDQGRVWITEHGRERIKNQEGVG